MADNNFEDLERNRKIAYIHGVVLVAAGVILYVVSTIGHNVTENHRAFGMIGAAVWPAILIGSALCVFYKKEKTKNDKE
jgi:lipopolysaccharide export LptBFGC system permease protein LptF